MNSKSLIPSIIAFLFLAIIVLILWIIAPPLKLVTGGLKVAYLLELEQNAPKSFFLGYCFDQDAFMQLTYALSGAELGDEEKNMIQTRLNMADHYHITLKDRVLFSKGELKTEAYSVARIPVFTFSKVVDSLTIWS